MNQKPLVLDDGTIEILDYTLCRIHAKGGIDTTKDAEYLWQNSLKARSDSTKQLGLAEIWATNSILNAQWINLGKVIRDALDPFVEF